MRVKRASGSVEADPPRLSAAPQKRKWPQSFAPAAVVMIRGYGEPWFARDDQFSNTKASCSHHGRSAAAMRSLIESEHGRRWATSLSRTIGER